MNTISGIAYSQQQGKASAPARERIAQAGETTDRISQEGTSAQTKSVEEKPPVVQVDSAALKQAIEKVNSKAAGLSPALKFEPDSETGVVVITVMNRETGEVIRQLPPEAVVKAAANGGEDLPALVKLTV